MNTKKGMLNKRFFLYMGSFFCLSFGIIYLASYTKIFSVEYTLGEEKDLGVFEEKKVIPPPVLDFALYDQKLKDLANNPPPPVVETVPVDSTNPSDTILAATSTPILPTITYPWPVKTVYPNAGAILPFKRIIAYYGNFYSTKMGVLGEYPEEQMLNMLRQEVKNWELADPSTPVVPAIDYIAVTAQENAGSDGMYRFRMSDTQVDHALDLAKKVEGIVILEIQPGLSPILNEVKFFEDYLKKPEVHLALDPEFAMLKSGVRPGKVIGSLDAKEINEVAEYLATLVRENNLPPKVLVIHRFTFPMVTNYQLIKPLPEVQIVMDMDGWGFPEKKINTYKMVIYEEPVQFTGFKLFYKNDLKSPSPRLLTPAEILNLEPRPSFIQYQ